MSLIAWAISKGYTPKGIEELLNSSQLVKLFFIESIKKNINN